MNKVATISLFIEGYPDSIISGLRSSLPLSPERAVLSTSGDSPDIPMDTLNVFHYQFKGEKEDMRKQLIDYIDAILNKAFES